MERDRKIPGGSLYRKAARFFRKNNMVLLIACLGVVLILAASSIFGKSDSDKQAKQQTEDAKEYVYLLEQRLEDILTAVPGVESCQVMITLKSGVEYVYEKEVSDAASESDAGDNRASEYEKQTKVAVVSDRSYGEQALVVSEIYPQINGVAIVCTGRDSASVKMSVIEAVSTVLAISSGRVCVIMKG